MVRRSIEPPFETSTSGRIENILIDFFGDQIDVNLQNEFLSDKISQTVK